MKANEMFNFLKNAIGKTIYVDVDGTILRSFQIPADVKGNKFFWWKKNLAPTKMIYSRIFFCFVLWLCGSKLIIWTNRSNAHKSMTVKNLGLAKFMFSEFRFFEGEKKATYKKDMFVIDDDRRYRGERTLNVVKI
jgi:hypothetical protein